MNENLNLYTILKNVPKGTKLYSPLFGEVEFYKFDNGNFPVVTLDTQRFERSFCINGKYYEKDDFPDAECMLFPSKDQRDWSKFKAPAQKVKVTLHPFDKVLVRNEHNALWVAAFFSHLHNNNNFRYSTCAGVFRYCIPYNEDTKHLVGTTDECPIEYEIEFKK